MPNMSYCRFRNTLGDLRDCYEHLHDPLIAGCSDGEHAARTQLLELCGKILEECGNVTVEIDGASIEITEHGCDR
jgi:hypothetical protein